MRKLISFIGILFAAIFFVLMIFSTLSTFNPTPDTEMPLFWSLMIMSLLAVIVAEALFFTECLIDLREEIAFGKILRMLLIIAAAILLYNFAYYGAVKTLICAVAVLTVCIAEIKSLFA